MVTRLPRTAPLSISPGQGIQRLLVRHQRTTTRPNTRVQLRGRGHHVGDHLLLVVAAVRVHVIVQLTLDVCDLRLRVLDLGGRLLDFALQFRKLLRSLDRIVGAIQRS